MTIKQVFSAFHTPGLHTLAVVLLAGIESGSLRPSDDLENLAWFPLEGPLPELAFEADRLIINRVHSADLEEKLPVDPDFAAKPALTFDETFKEQ